MRWLARAYMSAGGECMAYLNAAPRVLLLLVAAGAQHSYRVALRGGGLEASARFFIRVGPVLGHPAPPFGTFMALV